MIAPEPIFEPRGTPLSVVGRLKALSDMNHQVDLLTYPIGVDIELPGIRIFRTARWLGVRKVKIGPSLTKIPLDFFLMLKTLGRLILHRYDVIHTHEEAGFWGMVFAWLFRTPHIYDMHSSLPQQLSNFEFTRSKILVGIFRFLEGRVLKSASAVITICPDLYDHVMDVTPEKPSILIENVIDYGMIFGEQDKSDQIKETYQLDGKPVVLYAGTFEAYQGLDVLIDGAKVVLAEKPDTVFLMVGGHPEQVDKYRAYSREVGIDSAFIFTGQVKPQEVSSYIRCADLLLSPRISGTNTPLKIYSYLRSGVPVVATRLHTHTQVMNDDVSILTDPTPEGFARGILKGLTDSQLSLSVSEKAVALSEKEYSYDVYQEKFHRVLSQASGGDQ